MMKFLLSSCLSVAVLLSTPLGANAEEPVDFESKLLPVLETKCMSCHREAYKSSTGRTKKPKGGLRMDDPDALKEGGDSGDALTAKDPDKSSIYTRVILEEDDDEFMPPKGDAMTKEEVALLKKWIEAGADFGKWEGTEFTPEGDKVEADGDKKEAGGGADDEADKDAEKAADDKKE